MGARRQPALALQGAKRRHRLRVGPGIEKTGDPLPAHGVQCLGRRRQILGHGEGRQQVHRAVLGGVFEQAGGSSQRIAHDLAACGVGRVGLDAGQRDRPRIELHRVAEGGTHDDRARGVECIEGGGAGGHAVGLHALLEPVDHHQPAAGVVRATRFAACFAACIAACIASGPVALDAGLDAGLELRHRQRSVIEAAIEQPAAARLRVHVGVDQARHQHAPAQVDHAGALAGERGAALVVADVDDAAVPHGQRLAHAVGGIDGVDVAVAVDQVGRCGGVGTTGSTGSGSSEAEDGEGDRAFHESPEVQ